MKIQTMVWNNPSGSVLPLFVFKSKSNITVQHFTVDWDIIAAILSLEYRSRKWQSTENCPSKNTKIGEIVIYKFKMLKFFRISISIWKSPINNLPVSRSYQATSFLTPVKPNSLWIPLSISSESELQISCTWNADQS